MYEMDEYIMVPTDAMWLRIGHMPFQPVRDAFPRPARRTQDPSQAVAQIDIENDVRLPHILLMRERSVGGTLRAPPLRARKNDFFPFGPSGVRPSLRILLRFSATEPVSHFQNDNAIIYCTENISPRDRDETIVNRS